MNGFNLSDMVSAQVGSTNVSAVYYGATLIWPLETFYYKDWSKYEKQYFTIDALEDNCDVYMLRYGTSSYTMPAIDVYYSVNNGLWQTKSLSTCNSQTSFKLFTLSAGDKCRVKVSRNIWGRIDYWYAQRGDSIYFTKQVKLSGNINSLIKGDNFYKNYNFKDYNTNSLFACLFYTSTSSYRSKIIDVSNLFIPSYAFSDAGMDSENSSYYSNRCQFQEMFANLSFPKSPRIEIFAMGNEYFNYRSLFYNNSSLTDVSNILFPYIDKQLNYYALDGCFANCTALITAPKINIYKGTTGTFSSMYSGCSSLTNVEININTNGSYYSNWLDNTTNLTTITTNRTSDTSNTNFVAGKTLVASKIVDPFYFTIESLEDNNVISYYCRDNYNMIWDVYINGTKTKSRWAATKSTWNTLGTLNKGDIMQIVQSSSSYKYQPSTHNAYSRFGSTGNFIIYGTLHSISINSTDDKPGYNGLYRNLFYECAGLIDARNLIMPKNLNNQSYTFAYMFYKCTNLERAPRIIYSKNTNDNYYSFEGMFLECTKMYEGPEIRFKAHASGTYINDIQDMFAGCENLEYVGLRYDSITPGNYIGTDWLDGTTASKLTLNTNAFSSGSSDTSVTGGATLVDYKYITE
jgi:hypothetical protein